MSVRALRELVDLNATGQSRLGSPPAPSDHGPRIPISAQPWTFSAYVLSVIGVPVSSLSLAWTPRWTKPLRCIPYLVSSPSFSAVYWMNPGAQSCSPISSSVPCSITFYLPLKLLHGLWLWFIICHVWGCQWTLLPVPNSVHRVKTLRDSAPLLVKLPAQG